MNAAASNDPMFAILEGRAALSKAWAQVEAEELAASLRAMATKLRNRVLSAHRTPSSKVTPTTARLLATNLGRSSFHDRLRAADVICAPMIHTLGEVTDEVLSEASVDPLTQITEALGAAAGRFGPTMAVLAVVAGMTSEPSRFAPALVAAHDEGYLGEDLAAVAAEVRPLVEARLEALALTAPRAEDTVDADYVEALQEQWAEAIEAAGRIDEAVRAGGRPADDDIETVRHYLITLEEAAERLGTEPEVDAVVSAAGLSEARQAAFALGERLRSLSGPPSLAEEIAAVHAAAAAVEDDAALGDRLRRFLELVEATEPMERFSLASELRAQPAPPAPALLDAALAGLVSVDAAEDGPVPSSLPEAEAEAPPGPVADTTAAAEEDATGATADVAGTGDDDTADPALDDADARADHEMAHDRGVEEPAEDRPAPAPPAAMREAALAEPGGTQTTGAPKLAAAGEDGEPAADDVPNAPGEATQDGTGEPAAAAVAAPTEGSPTEPAATDSEVDERGNGSRAAGRTLAHTIEEAEEGQFAATTPAPAAEAAEAEPSHEEVSQTLAELVAARRFGLAHHLAVVVGHDYRATILAEAALADAVRATASAPAAEMVTRVATTQLNTSDVGSVVLRVAATTRVALLDPSSGAPALLRHLIASLGELPRLQEFAAAVVSALERNLTVPATGMSVDVADAHVQAQVIASWADDTLRRPPRQNRLYRGVEIWKQWIAPDGLLGSILSAVATNDPQRVPEVRSACVPLGDRRHRDEVLEAADKALREARTAQRIIGPAREHLLRGLEEIVEQALLWCESHGNAVGGRTNELRDELARRALRLREPILQELAAIGADDWARAAAAAAATTLTDTIGLLSNEGLEGTALTASAALNRGLTLVEGLPLDPELCPLARPSAAQLVRAAATSRAEAFAARLAARDYAAAEAIIDLQVGPADDIDEAAARQELRATERDELTRTEVLWRELDGRFAAARSRGRISDDDASRLQGMLLQAQPRATESEWRRDLGRVGAELDALAHELEEATDRRRVAVTADVTDAVASEELAPAWAAKLTELLDRDELGAAEEYLHRARAGEAAPEASETASAPDDALARLLAGPLPAVDDAVVEAARTGGSVGGLDFSSVAEIDRPSVATALEAWRSLSSEDRPADLSTALEPMLRLLGLIPTSIERPPALRSISTKGRWFVDVRGDKSGYAYVPDFGSRAAGRRRFMLCWDDLPMTQLWDLAAANAPADQPVYVLRLGLVSAQVRMELARHARRSNGQEVVVIDDAVILRCALAGRQSYDVTMRTVLPYAASNPYDPDLLAGTPEEMFYGRRAERQKIAAPAGSSFISGGRRLGKTALLRSVQSELEGTDVLALLIVIQHVAAVPPNDPAELWPVLAARLTEAGVLAPGTEGSADAVSAGVRVWLGDNPGRRLLLLLDECDFFLRADAQSSFANVVRLRDLMQYGDGRFKVVFSGLQHVARYRKLPNQPLSHLPQPLVIGPLDAASAAALVRRPLHALGWHISDAQVDRLVTFCACNPSVIQLACGRLVERLRSVPVEGLAPWPVREQVLNDMLSSTAVEKGVSERLFLTLRLDHRYLLLAYLLAWRALSEGLDASASPAELRRQALEYWPGGFAGQNPDDVRALCDELVGLGVFAGDAESGYRMLSPATVRLFGTLEEVTDELLSASTDYDPDVAAGAAGNRMALSEGRFSPLTASQLADVVGVGRTQLRVVVGSRALRAEAVPEALAVAGRRLGVTTTELTSTSRRRWRDSMSAPAEGHVVVTSDMTLGRSVDSWEQSIDAARRRGQTRTAKGTRSAVLIAGPSERWLLRDVVTTTDGRRGPLADVAVGLRRIDMPSLRAWDRIEELDLAHPARQQRLLTITGGWPMLVEQVIARMRQRPFDDAADELDAYLATPGGARALLAAAGLDPADPDQPADAGLVACFTRLAELGLRDTAVDVAGLLGIDDELHGEDDPAEAVAILALLGVLDEDEDGLVGAEPVLAACARLAAAAPVSA